MTTPIKSLTKSEIRELVAELGLPKFRADQLLVWLYQKGASSYGEMTNLPKHLREEFAAHYPLFAPTVEDKQVSRDGTRKYLLSFEGGYQAETVGIPSPDGRLTVCCSSQAGCAMGCLFCATGKNGFTSNLQPGEIVDQILHVQNDFSQRVTNVVVMGQGEPFLNFDSTVEALRLLNDPKLLNIGARHLTVSTCGIIPGIERFGELPEQFTLAISLHSAVQDTRDYLMPGVKQYPLNHLKDALLSYNEKSGRRVSFEYALMKGINDGPDDLLALERYCRKLICHVNLIPLNQVPGSPFKPVPSEVLNYWCETLNSQGISATVRISKGADIDGACGQLANRHK